MPVRVGTGRPPYKDYYGTSGFFDPFFALTSSIASYIAVSLAAVDGWLAVKPLATLAG